jgi:hypothetical protein
MKMKNVLLLLLLSIFFNNCIGDKIYTNLTIDNKSGSYIADFFVGDSLSGQQLIYKLIKVGDLNKNIEEVYPATPYNKAYIKSMVNWKLVAKSDTSVKYLYLINLNVIDSLKKNYNDSTIIMKKATILLKVTYNDLKKMGWNVIYK